MAGHDPFALYIDAFGSNAKITDVYVHDNTLQNQSQFFLTPSAGMPVVDLGGIWSNVQIWHNTITGLGATDRYNPLFEVDKQPNGGTNVVDCNDYGNLSTAGNTVNGNFALPSNDWLTLADWQAHNGHGWDADSAVGGFSAELPERVDPVTAAMRRPGLIAAFALAVAASVAATPASAAGVAPPGPAAARAPATKSQGPQASGGSGGSLPRANTPPPRHHGTLRIAGSLRDGGTVRAAGLSWRPGRLPPGDRLLSFEVAYYWDACTAAGKCRTGADTTVTPFAARRYVAGHADTSRFLKVTETATEVVETSPATFAFSLKSVSVSTTASRTVRAYRAGRAPVSEFVNGTPERRTASAEEYFSVAAPHYSAADGPAAQRYRVDHGRWRPMPASRRVLHRHPAHRQAPGGGAHRRQGRRDHRAVHLAGGADARAAALPGGAGPALLVPAAPRRDRAPDALGLADRPGDPAAADRGARRGHL